MWYDIYHRKLGNKFEFITCIQANNSAEALQKAKATREVRPLYVSIHFDQLGSGKK